MFTEPEREMRRVDVATDVEHVRGRAERGFVAVAGRVQHDQVVALVDFDATDDGVGGHRASERLDRRHPAQALLHRARDERGVGGEIGALVGVLEQREGAARDQRARRLVARDQQGQQKDQQFVGIE